MQWSLSSENIDIAIVCKDAAEKFVKADNRFEIAGPLVKNSDVILIKNKPVKSVGVIQNRNYQEKLANRYYPDKKRSIFIGNGIAYALESNKVDAIIVDAFKAFQLKGEKIPTNRNKDYVTYELVVNKKFMKTDTYKEFINQYNKSVINLYEDTNYRKALEDFFGKKLTNKEWEEIKKWQVKFLTVQNRKRI